MLSNIIAVFCGLFKGFQQCSECKTVNFALSVVPLLCDMPQWHQNVLFFFKAKCAIDDRWDSNCYVGGGFCVYTRASVHT